MRQLYIFQDYLFNRSHSLLDNAHIVFCIVLIQVESCIRDHLNLTLRVSLEDLAPLQGCNSTIKGASKYYFFSIG